MAAWPGLPGRHPVQVEFFGLPGSGKTTVAHALRETLRASDPGIIFTPELTRDDAPGLRRTFARLLLIGRNLPRQGPDLHVLRLVAATTQRTRRDKAKAIFNLLTVMSLFSHIGRGGENAIIDQGILQAAWSVHMRLADEIPPTSWAPLLSRHLTGPRVFVCVETPVGVCIDRLESRKSRHSRMQSGQLLHDPVAWGHAEAVRERLIGVLTGILGSHGAMHRLINVDGTADPQEAATKVAMQLHHAPEPRSALVKGRPDAARRSAAP